MTRWSRHTPARSAAQPAARRQFLRQGAALAGALGLGSLGALSLAPRTAHAADYKALVCVFLYGGNDGLNTFVPTDAARHAQYAAVRRHLALPLGALLPMDGTAYGLHPALAALQPAWRAGHLAPVFNVGPLARPLTKAQYRAEPEGSADVPANLFSHSDQQILWECSAADVLVREGWGGRAADLLDTRDPVISVGGNTRFGLTAQRSPLVLPGPGSVFGAYTVQPSDLGWTPNQLRKEALDALYAPGQGHGTMASVYAREQRAGFGVSERLRETLLATPGSAAAFAAVDAAFAPITSGGEIGTHLGAQLYQVAKLVAANATVQGSRQVFFAEAGGFDTHADQVVAGNATAGTHAALLAELGDALAAFQRAMEGLGLADAVTTFTQSDFGRTFAINSTLGTDHAWGNNHLVLGGAVRGGRTYGSYPELALGGPDDVGVDDWELQGRWIPTTSVDQYAATLLRWFGASDGQLDSVLPNLGGFATRRLGFL